MLKITKPNGVVFHAPKDKMVDIVLELNGGGYTERQVVSAMADASVLRDGNEVKINGYTLQLVGDKNE